MMWQSSWFITRYMFCIDSYCSTGTPQTAYFTLWTGQCLMWY